MLKKLLGLRRSILKSIVPEIVWPQHVVIDDTYIKVRNTPYSFGVKWLLLRRPNDYELPERSFVAELAEGDHVLEFGGSIGILTALIARKVGKKGKIVSIEASESIVLYSKNWLENIGNVLVLCAYAFPIMHRVPMKASFDSGGGSLGGQVAYEHLDNESSVKNEQHFFIEDANEISNFTPNVLFIDIEGSEQIMLEHKPTIPKTISKIVIELHPSMYGQLALEKIIEVIIREGFELNKRVETVYQFLRHEPGTVT